MAYLVRRLLENGANSSFVNRISDSNVTVSELIADPVEIVAAMPVVGTPHDQIALPADLFGRTRKNSQGLDISDESTLASLSQELAKCSIEPWHAFPRLADDSFEGTTRAVANPADHSDQIGFVTELAIADAARIMELAQNGMKEWAATSTHDRAACLERAADLMQSRMAFLMAIAIREAGKTTANAIGEVREAIDMLRYYAEQARATLGPSHYPLGPIVCISPWNFPLAIFTGQVAAALVAGNSVIAKPASVTPIIAHESVKILHEAGVPRGALQFAPGSGRFGAALVAAPQTAGVIFTGSTEVARQIQLQLSERLSPAGRPIPLVAETGGQNAMIVDSSALAEQVVADVIASAFDSAGQRCSALRVLCLQEDVAERTLEMLKGALRELALGRTDKLLVDIGPVINESARKEIDDHIQGMSSRGKKIDQVALPVAASAGTFVSPTIIEIESLSELEQEVFGPVLHVMRFSRDNIENLIEEINGTGYGLTFGLHTRLDETIANVTSRVKAGNIYVNRNIIGAVVGVQPFGGRGLSGTGPKAGGPLYVARLVQNSPVPPQHSSVQSDPAVGDFASWLGRRGHNDDAASARELLGRSALGLVRELPGPVGERNIYALHPRGKILLVPASERGLYRQIAATLATGNDVVIDRNEGWVSALQELPASVSRRLLWTVDWQADGPYSGALLEGDGDRVQDLVRRLAKLKGPLIPAQSATTSEILANPEVYNLNMLLEEVTTSINTAAAGGNASLMAIG